MRSSQAPEHRANTVTAAMAALAGLPDLLPYLGNLRMADPFLIPDGRPVWTPAPGPSLVPGARPVPPPGREGRRTRRGGDMRYR
ncbi:uncharacterized protein SAZU_6038 [Streptomyces azureus]|uniref:Uncharacterized protein n=1 Tax=Streptomyces azureus TaxID=146537 RepID=A0A0K8PTH1_STRAJ|nr:uncharacterized protein SAZU_6038 [Streptomyces azureus]